MSYDIKQIFEDEVSNIDKSFKVDKDKFLREALGEDSFIKMTEEFGQAPQPRKESMKSQKPDNRQEQIPLALDNYKKFGKKYFSKEYQNDLTDQFRR